MAREGPYDEGGEAAQFYILFSNGLQDTCIKVRVLFIQDLDSVCQEDLIAYYHFPCLYCYYHSCYCYYYSYYLHFSRVTWGVFNIYLAWSSAWNEEDSVETVFARWLWYTPSSWTVTLLIFLLQVFLLLNC